MSGTCLEKRGEVYSCSQCESDGLDITFNFCPYCGEKIIMWWDVAKDESL